MLTVNPQPDEPISLLPVRQLPADGQVIDVGRGQDAAGQQGPFVQVIQLPLDRNRRVRGIGKAVSRSAWIRE